MLHFIYLFIKHYFRQMSDMHDVSETDRRITSIMDYGDVTGIWWAQQTILESLAPKCYL
jgi:hypothetical protein